MPDAAEASPSQPLSSKPTNTLPCLNHLLFLHSSSPFKHTNQPIHQLHFPRHSHFVPSIFSPDHIIQLILLPIHPAISLSLPPTHPPLSPGSSLTHSHTHLPHLVPPSLGAPPPTHPPPSPDSNLQ